MNKKLKNLTVTVCFVVILFGFALANFIKSDGIISYSERRKLAQAPAFSFSELLSGDYFDDTETYHLDQFFGRNFFRSVKAYFKKYVLLATDNNGVFEVDGALYKLNFELNDNSIYGAALKLNSVADEFLGGCNLYYGVVPDKNHYLDGDYYPRLDYGELVGLLKENVTGMTYVEIEDLLTTADFYKTDLHWSQDSILPVADAFLRAFGCEELASDIPYLTAELAPFYGSYYGQAALGGEADSLRYLYNDAISSMTVYDYETGETHGVYRDELLNSVDGYSVFLSGAKALLRIDNPVNQNGKTLYLFRDSLGSSLAPLLAQEYQTVYLIDLRYISSEKLGEYISFEAGSDALFLYGAELINNSGLFLN